MIGRIALPLGCVLLLAACGARGALEPAAGEPLPVAPYGKAAQPTPEQLLEPGPQARPERSDELLRESHPRDPDPFDLPPTG